MVLGLVLPFVAPLHKFPIPEPHPKNETSEPHFKNYMEASMHEHDIDYLRQMILDALETEPENDMPDGVPNESADTQELISIDCFDESISEDVRFAAIAAKILREHKKAFEELAKW